MGCVKSRHVERHEEKDDNDIKAPAPIKTTPNQTQIKPLSHSPNNNHQTDNDKLQKLKVDEKQSEKLQKKKENESRRKRERQQELEKKLILENEKYLEEQELDKAEAQKDKEVDQDTFDWEFQKLKPEMGDGFEELNNTVDNSKQNMLDTCGMFLDFEKNRL